MSLCTPMVAFYAQRDITKSLLKWLETHQLYEDGIDTQSELKKLYQSFQRDGLIKDDDPSQNWITHLWVACDGETPIAVALLQNSFTYALQLYVKNAYRRQGLGERLLKLALEVKRPFGVFYTASSERLYGKYGLRNDGA